MRFGCTSDWERNAPSIDCTVQAPSKMNWDDSFGYLLPGGVNEELYRFPHRVRLGFGTGERNVGRQRLEQTSRPIDSKD